MKISPVFDSSTIGVTPSYRCTTANCIDCYLKRNPLYPAAAASSELEPQAVCRFLVEYARTIRLQEVYLFGGEILEYSRLEEFLQLLHDELPGVRLNGTTNGQLPERLERLPKELLQKFCYLAFSVDGYGTQCDRLRGRDGYFGRVMDSINQYASKHCGAANVGINMIYRNDHESDLLKTIEFIESRASTLGFETTYCMIPLSGDPEYLRRYVHFLESKCSRIALDPGMVYHRRKYLREFNHSTYFIGIKPDGSITTCYDSLKGFVMGNVLEAYSVAEILCRIVSGTFAPCVSQRCEHYAIFSKLLCGGYRADDVGDLSTPGNLEIAGS